mgnify:CR=1 FL=1
MSEANEQRRAAGEPRRTTIRLRIDRMPKDLVRLSDDRTIALLWGREIAIPSNQPLGFRGAKLWNRAGETLVKIMKARGLSQENPMTVDLTGSVKIDKHNQRENFEASFFKIVGDRERAPATSQNEDPANPASNPETHDSHTGRRTDNAEARGQNDAGRPRGKREFEHDLAVTGILDVRTEKDGHLVSEIVAMKTDEWEKASPEEREDDSRMFRVVLLGEAAKTHAEIQAAADWNGPYMDVQNPVVLRVKGTWDKLDAKSAAANAP